MKAGFVYILLNPSFPNELKIGQTKDDPRSRAQQLAAATGVPSYYIVAYSVEVSDCELVEKVVHQQLDAYRDKNQKVVRRSVRKKEFFKIQIHEALEKITEVVDDLLRQGKLSPIEKKPQIISNRTWWTSLPLFWQQIFRSHLKINYQPTESDVFDAIFQVIEYCQNNTLRLKISERIQNHNFATKLLDWYENPKKLRDEKEIFNSYLPYVLSEEEIKTVLELKEINCSNNLAVLDLKPLENLKQLKSINCVNTNISDIKPLEKLLFLERITCYDTKISQKQIDDFSKKNPNCSIDSKNFLTGESNTKSKSKKMF